MSRNQRRKKRNRSGAHPTPNRTRTRDSAEDQAAGAVHHRPSTETKSSLRTTELVAYAGAVLAVVITALAVDGDGDGGGDPFGAESALRYITYLTIGYVVARGLAKSGSHENRVEHDSGSDDDRPARTAVAEDHEELDAPGPDDQRPDDHRAQDDRAQDDRAHDSDAHELRSAAPTGQPVAGPSEHGPSDEVPFDRERSDRTS